jgi:chromosomal replication initiator protein
LKNTWHGCLEQLERELSQQLFNTWIRPLQAQLVDGTVHLLAPNGFVLEQVSNRFQARIRELLAERGLALVLEIGSSAEPTVLPASKPPQSRSALLRKRKPPPVVDVHLNFESFIEGKSNRLARASALLVSENCGGIYNPLLLYGGVGLGKTHLLHAIGNALLKQRSDARVAYVSAERFVADMVSALQQNRVDGFKDFYQP